MHPPRHQSSAATDRLLRRAVRRRGRYRLNWVRVGVLLFCLGFWVLVGMLVGWLLHH